MAFAFDALLAMEFIWTDINELEIIAIAAALGGILGL